MRTFFCLCLLSLSTAIVGCKPKGTQSEITPPVERAPLHQEPSKIAPSPEQNPVPPEKEKVVPGEVTLSGQIFVVTRGSENIKLGLIEVLLIQKSQVTEFLGQRLPIIESEMSRQKQKTEAAKAALQKCVADCNLYESNGPLFSAEYKSMKAQFVPLRERQAVLGSNAIVILHEAESGNWHDQNWSLNVQAKANGLKYELDWISNRLNILAPVIEKCGKIEADALTESNRLWLEYQTSTNEIFAANSNLTECPSPEVYFSETFPSGEQKALSDADGKFSFKYEKSKAYALYAKGERAVGEKNEKYFWLVDAPTNSETAQILLSNHNLVYSDPDGYFKIKPKHLSALEMAH